MEHAFWHRRWHRNEIGFHQTEANSLLVEYFNTLKLPASGRIFVPLCGKSLDMVWLAEQGHQISGIELNRSAVEQFFDELELSPDIEEVGPLTRFSAANVELYVGDLFALTPEQLGPIDLIYDRAALVALPEGMRKDYTAQLVTITRCAPQLLISFDYDQKLLPGPPFSVTGDEILKHYHAHYQPTMLQSNVVPGGLKGKCPANETIWLLTPAQPAQQKKTI